VYAVERRSQRTVRSTHRRADVGETSRVELRELHHLRDGPTGGGFRMNATPVQKNTAGVSEAARAGVLHQAWTIYVAIFASPVGPTLVVLLVAMTAAILVTTYGQIILNKWNQPFYDAITRRDLHDFFYQLGVYFAIVSGLLVLDVTQR